MVGEALGAILGGGSKFRAQTSQSFVARSIEEPTDSARVIS